MKWCMKETDSTEEIARIDLSDISCTMLQPIQRTAALLLGFREVDSQDVVHPWPDLCRIAISHASLGKLCAPAGDVVDG